MRRALLFCSALVAACQLPLAAASPLSEDVPVPRAVASLADSLGLPAASYRATFVADLVRLVYNRPKVENLQVVAELRAHAAEIADMGAAPVLVPISLSADIWSRVVLRRAIAPGDLLASIVSDRRAALLCHGLAGLDDETLAFLVEHPDVLTDLYEHLTPAFGVFGSSLHVHGGRVVPPGGDAAGPLWEAAVGAPLDRPDRFVHALYSANVGRVAYLYDTVAELDPPHAAFALGSWIADEKVRKDRFLALTSAVARGYREWPVDERPFVRPLNDIAIVFMRLRVDQIGRPGAPASREFWNGVFDMSGAAAPAASDSEGGSIDAAYLAEATSVADMYVRADRVDELSFAQRVFAAAGHEADKDAALALRAMPRQRMLLLTLERLGITRPAVYATASRAAKDATSGDPNHAFWTLAQFQGTLAIVARLRRVGTIDPPTAERLVLSLCSVPTTESRTARRADDESRRESHGYDGGIAQWIETDLLPTLPAAHGPEARLVLGLSGPMGDPSNPRVSWEGQEYRLDFGAANARRLRAVREKQSGYSLDAALDLARVARPTAALKAGDPHASAHALAAVADEFQTRSKNALVDTLAAGVTAPPPPRERINRALADLAGIDEAREPDRALHAMQPIVETADTLLADALLSLVYAVDIGDPDGTALLASNVAMRHDFGFALHDGEGRARRPWDVPRQDVQPGAPWRVTGALLGLDVALAPLSLRHIDLDRPAAAPRLGSTEREAFAADATQIDQQQLRDSDRQVVVAAITRGRARVEALSAGDTAGVAAIAAALRMDGWRTRALQWTLAHQPSSAASLFPLVELVALGGGAPGVNLDAWGTSAYLSAGCMCSRMLPPGGWRLFEGRAQLPFASFVVSDLNLRVAALLDDLHLPAALELPVLACAVQDLIDDAAPADDEDWLTIAQSAQALTRQRVEDYVAAAAAVDGPLVPVEEGATARRP
jgi:hypothetical protein